MIWQEPAEGLAAAARTARSTGSPPIEESLHEGGGRTWRRRDAWSCALQKREVQRSARSAHYGRRAGARGVHQRGVCVLAGSPTMREVDERVSGSTSKVEAGLLRRTGTELATIRALPTQDDPGVRSRTSERGERTRNESPEGRTGTGTPSGEARARNKAGKKTGHRKRRARDDKRGRKPHARPNKKGQNPRGRDESPGPDGSISSQKYEDQNADARGVDTMDDTRATRAPERGEHHSIFLVIVYMESAHYGNAAPKKPLARAPTLVDEHGDYELIVIGNSQELGEFMSRERKGCLRRELCICQVARILATPLWISQAPDLFDTVTFPAICELQVWKRTNSNIPQ
ncbi:hypothetical protein B0H13DRAFT_1861792 [Mycena leptocephala]|nr:hypothetical protein B0H13DRAFT_1861792 [Mycena leptocephala]